MSDVNFNLEDLGIGLAVMAASVLSVTALYSLCFFAVHFISNAFSSNSNTRNPVSFRIPETPPSHNPRIRKIKRDAHRFGYGA